MFIFPFDTEKFKAPKMCLSPVRIENPNYHSNLPGAKYKDTTSYYINVPCGHCTQCIASKQMQLVQRVQMEETTNHIFFATLTYNDEMIPSVLTSSGYEVRYADIKDIQNMFKRIRKDDLFGRPFRYFYVSELGSKRGRPHFHLLLLVPKYPRDTFNDCLNLERKMWQVVLDQWKRNVGISTRFPTWKPLCTFTQKMIHGKLYQNYDLHYVNPRTTNNGAADVGFYVLKYMLKRSDKEIRRQQALKLNLPPDEYEAVWKLVKSKHNFSHFFGLSDPSHVDYVKQCVQRSPKDEYPKFYRPTDGKPFPLARFYKSKGETFSLEDFLKFKRPDDNVYLEELDTKGTKKDIALKHERFVENKTQNRDITALISNN